MTCPPIRLDTNPGIRGHGQLRDGRERPRPLPRGARYDGPPPKGGGSVIVWKRRMEGAMKFEVNVHPIERVARVVVGVVLASLAFWGPKSPWFLLGLAPVVTGALGWCPPYSLLGINTCKTGKTPA